MRTKKKTHIHGLLLNWLVSYAVILLIAFFFILSGYLLLSRNLRAEYIRVHRANVQQSQISLDYLLSEIMMITSEVILLPEIQSLGGYEKPLGSRQYYLKNQLRDDLSKLHGSHPAVESVFVYFWPNNYIVSSVGAYDVDFYFNDKYSESGMTQSAWLEVLLTKGNMVNAVSLIQTSGGDVSEPYVQFIASGLPMFAGGKTRISICVTVREESIKDFIRRPSVEGTFFIVDSRNSIFLSNSEDLPKEIPTYQQLTSNTVEGMVVGDSILVNFPSNLLDWQYVSVSSQSVVESRLTRLRWWALAMIIFFWIIGTLVAYLLARRNYRPINKLVDFVSGHSGTDEFTHFRREEYRFIEESFSRLREEKASIQDQLTLQYESLRIGFLARLLQGKITETTHTLEEQCEYNGLYFEDEAFIAVLLRMEETILSEEQLSQERGAGWLKNQIQEMLQKNTNGAGWVCEINNVSVLFINLQRPSEEPRLSLISLLGDLNDWLLRETGITYTIGASCHKYDLASVPLAYEEASEALDHRLVRGKGAVITYYDVMDQEKEQRIFNSLIWERRFVSLFSAGDYRAATDLVRDIMTRFERIPSLPKLRIRLFGFVSLFLDVIDERFEATFIRELDCEARLLACTTLNETRDEIETIMGEIQENTRGNHSSSLEERVSSIIEESYHDPNLSVASIAEKIGLSLSNFSWIYKEETGTGPLERIHRARLREAKALLQNSNRTVKEISGTCGYLSDIAFIRVFKKYEGIPPGQFRRLSRPHVANPSHLK